MSTDHHVSDAAEVRRLETENTELKALLRRERQRADQADRRAKLAEDSAARAWALAWRQPDTRIPAPQPATASTDAEGDR